MYPCRLYPLSLTGWSAGIRLVSGWYPAGKHFSNRGAQVVNMLTKELGIETFASVNVLSDARARPALKEWSDFPTIPQIFINGEYLFEGKNHDNSGLIQIYEELIKRYPIKSIEDPLDEDDWDGWKAITKKIGDEVSIVGDDLFVTNKKILEKGKCRAKD